MERERDLKKGENESKDLSDRVKTYIREGDKNGRDTVT